MVALRKSYKLSAVCAVDSAVFALLVAVAAELLAVESTISNVVPSSTIVVSLLVSAIVYLRSCNIHSVILINVPIDEYNRWVNFFT